MYRNEKKIPTILALFLLSLGLGGIILFNQQTHQLGSNAKSGSRPEDVHFTNVSDNSFTLSWISTTSTLGTITVNDNGHTITYLEDTDSDNIARPRITHFVTVKNLKENTSYSVKIISGENNCKISDDCPTYVQKTAGHLSVTSALPAARGSIITEDNKPADNAIVYLTIGKSPPLSSKTDTLGLWVIPFNNLRTSDLLTRPNLADNDIVQIIAKTETNKKAEAVTDVKSIRNSLTIPPLQIGKSYNFIDLISKKDMLAGLNKSNTLGLQTQVTGKTNSIDILFPAHDEDTTTDNQPRFRGIAPKGTQLILIVNSAPQTAKIIAGSDGTWIWRPPSPLDPGTHHLGVSGYDENGSMINLTRSFIVFKSGERVLGDATASATLTPTLLPVPSATPTLSLLPSPTITLIPITNPTITSGPYISLNTPTPTLVVPPKTGNTNLTLLLLGSGATILLVGLKLLLFP